MNGEFHFGRFELNAATRQLFADGSQLALGARAFDLLVALVDRRDRMVSKDELLQICWPGLVVEENNLDVQISVLRKALGPGVIETVRGRGYRFVLKLESDPPPASERLADAPRRPAAHMASSTRPDEKSIAVLPFSNMSDNTDAGYFADGVHEDLLTQLALLGELKVVSRTSVMDYRDTKKKVRQIASELQVGSLVEGTVRRAGDHVRVTAQLIDAGSDKHLWAKSYDRELKDIFAIQSELATEIARALSITLSPKAETQLASRSTDNLEAYDLYLQARERYNQSKGTIRVVSSIKDRIALLSKAVEVDPGFAHAWAQLAEEHARAYFRVVDRTSDRQAQARSAMERALALAPEDLVVRIAEGNCCYMALGDTDRAGQAYDKVLSVAPHNVAALDGLALMLGARGQERERVALMERALAVDPRNVSAIWRLCQDHFWYRHFDQALAYQRRLLEIRPDDVSLRAEYHRIEYCRTGSWTSYDEWRRSLPRAAEFTHEDVREMDVKRAAARRDYAEVLRLANIIPDEGRGRANLLQIELLNQCWQAYAHRAAGNRTLALESARAGTRLAETQIARSPRDWIARYMLATLQAVLGERDSVWETHAGAVAVAQQEDNAHQADRARRHDFYLHAILGDRAEALSGAACQLESPGWQAHEFRVSLELADLWDDPQFQTLVDDPKNNGPLPIRNRNLSRAKDC